MAETVYAIDDFPGDDLLWRIEWLGGVGYSTSVPSDPLIDVCLAQLPAGEMNPLSGFRILNRFTAIRQASSRTDTKSGVQALRSPGARSTSASLSGMRRSLRFPDSRARMVSIPP